MSLADRIRSAQPNAANAGCRTCHWWKTITPETQRLINEWLAAKYSVLQLYDILSTPGEDITEPLLPVSATGFRMHAKHHAEKCRA